MKIVATVTGCAQVGQNAYRDCHYSKTFDANQSFSEILEWAKKQLGQEIVHIHEIQFSELED